MKSSHSTDTRRYLNLYFQVHQPRRLQQFRFFDIGTGKSYFDDGLNAEIMRGIASRCYLPANQLLLKLIGKHPGIRVTFSLSGLALEQLEHYAPEALASFKLLAGTGAVEFLAETYYHSLAFLTSKNEFEGQVRKHQQKMQELLGVKPTVLRNTELIYSDDLGHCASEMGFKGMYTDGIDSILLGRTPHRLFEHPQANGLKLFLRHYRLSDDIAFRFSNRQSKDWPLTARKFNRWLEKIPMDNSLINLAMDYETFGEHHKTETGIFTFLEQLLTTIVRRRTCTMVTPTEAIDQLIPADTIKVPGCISWADRERDLSAWLGNEIQRDAFDSLNRLWPAVQALNHTGFFRVFRYLQTSDHFYYMSTKKNDDGNVHQYFSPYASPYEAFINYMNVLGDFEYQLDKEKGKQKEQLGKQRLIPLRSRRRKSDVFTAS